MNTLTPCKKLTSFSYNENDLIPVVKKKCILKEAIQCEYG